jgi:hypothetical protein
MPQDAIAAALAIYSDASMAHGDEGAATSLLKKAIERVRKH